MMDLGPINSMMKAGMQSRLQTPGPGEPEEMGEPMQDSEAGLVEQLASDPAFLDMVSQIVVGILGQGAPAEPAGPKPMLAKGAM